VPVQRFRSLEDARRALWLKPGDPRLERATAWVWALSDELLRAARLRNFVARGVKKFRSIEEANADRQRWETERSRFLRKLYSSESKIAQS
jgi:hypothetical protein